MALWKLPEKKVKRAYSMTLDEEMINYFIEENPNVPLSYLVNEILTSVMNDAHQVKPNGDKK